MNDQTVNTPETHTCPECERLKMELQELKVDYDSNLERVYQDLKTTRNLIGKLVMHIYTGRNVFMLSAARKKAKISN